MSLSAGPEGAGFERLCRGGSEGSSFKRSRIFDLLGGSRGGGGAADAFAAGAAASEGLYHDDDGEYRGGAIRRYPGGSGG